MPVAYEKYDFIRNSHRRKGHFYGYSVHYFLINQYRTQQMECNECHRMYIFEMPED